MKVHRRVVWGRQLIGTRTSGLIHDEDATAAENCACQAQQLPLTDGGIATVICSTQESAGETTKLLFEQST